MADFKNYRKLVSTIKTIDPDATPDYDKDVRILNKAIGELLVLTPQQTEGVLKELNGIHSNIKTFAERYWRPEKFDLKNELAVIIYKRFLSEHFYITWPLPDIQDQLFLDLSTMHNIIWRVKYNSTLLFKIKKQITPTIQTTNINGFISTLNDTQIKNLYSKMQGNYFDATPDNFKAIFKDEPLPPDFSIKWIDKGNTRHEPNKQTIFEFLYLLKDFGYFDKSIFDILNADRNNLYRKLETLFPDIKNFPQSNPQASQNKTLRQIELKTIISTL